MEKRKKFFLSLKYTQQREPTIPVGKMNQNKVYKSVEIRQAATGTS